MTNSFKGREARNICWEAKDKYWACLDEAEKAINDPEKAKSKCADLRELFTTGCGHKWTEHFDRKREYLKFKSRIEAEGVRAVDEKELLTKAPNYIKQHRHIKKVPP